MKSRLVIIARGLYFLAVVFATTITLNILQTSYQTLLSPWHRTRHTRSLPSTVLHNALGTVQLFNSAYFTQLNGPTVVDANIERAKVSTKPLLHDKLLPIEEYPNFILHRETSWKERTRCKKPEVNLTSPSRDIVPQRLRFTCNCIGSLNFKPSHLWTVFSISAPLPEELAWSCGLKLGRTLCKEHTCQVSDHSSKPVLQEVAQKLKKQSRDKTV